MSWPKLSPPTRSAGGVLDVLGRPLDVLATLFKGVGHLVEGALGLLPRLAEAVRARAPPLVLAVHRLAVEVADDLVEVLGVLAEHGGQVVQGTEVSTALVS